VLLRLWRELVLRRVGTKEGEGRGRKGNLESAEFRSREEIDSPIELGKSTELEDDETARDWECGCHAGER
jgi:hypothetical protein